MLKQLLLAPLLVLSLTLTACGGTKQERQENADQLFGLAKVSMNVATISVGAYNVLCTDTLVQSAICAKNISEIVNSTMAKAGDAIKSAEAIFAAGSSAEGTKLDYAKVAMATVSELVALVAKYRLTKLGQG